VSDEHQFAGLYVHSSRPSWGLAVLSHEAEGKRHYLFEDGCRRALARDFDALMTRVDVPTPEQHAAYTRLKKLVIVRPHGERTKDSDPEQFETQLAALRQRYPGGLSDPKWDVDFRGGPRHAAIERAHEALAPAELASLLSARRSEEVWERLSSILLDSGLVAPSQVKVARPSAQPLHEAAVAISGLLTEEGPYSARFDRYVAGLTALLGKAPSWELATAPAALVYPREHVCVDLATFRRLVKLSHLRRPIPVRPSGTAYAPLLGLARSLARKLSEQGEAPRDLLDVHDFMTLTLVPTRAAKAAAT